MTPFHSLRRFAGASAFFACAVAATLAPSTASALAFSDLVIFGDSLSDTGNLSLATSGLYPGTAQPYDGGRYSNGPVWTEYLATGLGLSYASTPSLAGGNNYAFAGARTGGVGADNVPGLLAQTVGIWGASHATADANALYVLVGGGNDMRDARSRVGGDDLTRQADALAAVSNLYQSMGYLASKGAKNVLISNLPDLGYSFEAVLLGKTLESSSASLHFNNLIGGLEAYGDSLGMDVDVLDMNGALLQVRNNPAAFGITDIDHPCAGFAYSTGVSCSTSLFSDVLHPSSRAHQIIANAAFQALGVTPVPEPETVVLMLAGLVVVVGAARRRKQTA